MPKPKQNQLLDIHLAVLPDETADQWASRIVSALCAQHTRNATSHPLNLSKQKIKLENFPASRWNYYMALQQKMAEKIPAESLRPTIHLQLRGKNQIGAQPTVGLLGGMGPLSDASALDMLIQKHLPMGTTHPTDAQVEEALQNISIDLFSCPPPNNHVLKNNVKFAKNLSRYVKRIYRFFNHCPIETKIFILCNTAHAHSAFYKRLSHSRLFNLVDRVVEQIRQDMTPATNVLILGTTKTANSKLYSGKLKAKNIVGYTPEKIDQERLQMLITQVKSGDNNHDASEKLIMFIDEQVEKRFKKTGQYPTHILLGCTELPLALHGKLESLTDSYRQKGINIKFTNSEAIFVNEIRNFTNPKNNRLSSTQPRSKPILPAFHQKLERHKKAGIIVQPNTRNTPPTQFRTQ